MTHMLRAHAQYGAQATNRPDWYPSEGAHDLDAPRRSQAARRADALRWRVRWQLQQRRPRPAYGDSAIDHLISGTRNLLMIAAIIAIGG